MILSKIWRSLCCRKFLANERRRFIWKVVSHRMRKCIKHRKWAKNKEGIEVHGSHITVMSYERNAFWNHRKFDCFSKACSSLQQWNKTLTLLINGPLWRESKSIPVKRGQGRKGPDSPHKEPVTWASYQIRQIAVCACAGNAGNVFPATDFKGKC